MDKIYDLVGARKDDVFVFTSSGAESVGQVLWSVFLKVARETGKCHFIASAVEDAPTMQMMKRLEELGCFVKIAPVNMRGEIDVEKLAGLISARTACISVSIAQGLTGVIQPVEEIAKIASEKGVLLHLDATSALGKMYFSFEELGADYLTFSHDATYSGGLFAKKTAPLVPLILGGSSLRGGIVNTPALAALSAACKQASMALDAVTLETARLRDQFEKEIHAEALFRDALRLPNVSVIAFPGCHQDALHYLLNKKNIAANIGGDFSQHLSALTNSMHAISFPISSMPNTEHIQQAVQQLQSLAHTLIPEPTHEHHTDYAFSKKLASKIEPFRFGGYLTEKEGMRLVVGKEKNLALYWLVDETDGVIADAKFQAFGPIALLAAAEIVCELCMRKNYTQASRISADLIDQHVRDRQDTPAFPKSANTLLNCVLSAIDSSVQLCQGIPCPSSDYDVTPIAWDSGENPNGIPGWEEFALDKKLHLIEEIIDKEIRPYVELDAGGIQIVELKDSHELFIAYQGSCTTCHSATGSTLSAVQQILRARVFPKITVTPVL